MDVVFTSMVQKNKEDTMKLGVLYLVTNFLFTKSKEKLIDLVYLDMVNSGVFMSSSLGKEVFNVTLHSLSLE